MIEKLGMNEVVFHLINDPELSKEELFNVKKHGLNLLLDC